MIENEEKYVKKPTEEKAFLSINMLRGFALSAIISGYILGPLLVLGGFSFWLYKNGIINKWASVGIIILSFIISNYLIITKSKKLIENFSKKANLKDPTSEEVKKWNENRPESYKYNDEEENKED
jgi:hypothetical protein